MRKLLWTAGGLGLVPVAPGTFGTLAGVGLAALALLLPRGADAALLVATIVVTLGGVPLAQAAEAEAGREDPGSFVVDEVAGYLVAVLWLPLGERPWTVLLGAFLLFRLFDIAKPWPIRRVERIGRGWGVMLDDLVAGVLANLALRLVLLWL